eukprot:scaffold156541_cov17-Tisochrysis_lutea.AAC.1
MDINRHVVNELGIWASNVLIIQPQSKPFSQFRRVCEAATHEQLLPQPFLPVVYYQGLSQHLIPI